jgi:hypothetical protein
MSATGQYQLASNSTNTNGAWVGGSNKNFRLSNNTSITTWGGNLNGELGITTNLNNNVLIPSFPSILQDIKLELFNMIRINFLFCFYI